MYLKERGLKNFFLKIENYFVVGRNVRQQHPSQIVSRLSETNVGKIKMHRDGDDDATEFVRRTLLTGTLPPENLRYLFQGFKRLLNSNDAS